MPFLISVQALEKSCPGITIDPIDHATALSAANGTPLQLIGYVNLHFRFHGPSVERVEDGEHNLSGLTMQFWYPACAAVFTNLHMPYIMSASLLRIH